jgi:hypothetical protein
MYATGTFEVNLQPLDAYSQSGDGNTLGRMSIDKTFQGDLEATSQGEMLSARTPIEGSAGYVAIERIVGMLDGRSGSFVLQHFGVMHGGENRLLLEVTPGSGTGDLAGLTGTMVIGVTDGAHTYAFDYTLD